MDERHGHEQMALAQQNALGFARDGHCPSIDIGHQSLVLSRGGGSRQQH